ncbi:hypothetical protein HDF26_002821 [Pedobacter cryoconitis]|nr:hypothetical protein [Pedobacter cryoconitis]
MITPARMINNAFLLDSTIMVFFIYVFYSLKTSRLTNTPIFYQKKFPACFSFKFQ